MTPYELGKLAVAPEAAMVDPGTYWGRFKQMIRNSKVAPYALGGGLALGALYGIPKLYDKLTEPSAEPAMPQNDQSTELLKEILARTQKPEPAAVPAPRFTNDPASDNYWNQVMAVSAAKRLRDRQMLGGLTGEQR